MLTLRSSLFVVFAWCAGLGPADAQTQESIGTCQWWKLEQREATDHENRSAAEHQLVRTLYVLGFVNGMGASPVAYFGFLSPEGVSALAPLRQYGTAGLDRLYQRPVVLIEAFDKHCSDYRNAQLQLADVAIIAVYEVGGASSASVAASFDALRRPDPVLTRRRLVLEALARQ